MAGLQVSVAPRSTPLWEAAAEFVRSRYAHAYGADITPDPDCFIVARTDGSDRIVGCGGMTFHSGAGFFSERYLHRPLEETLAGLTVDAVERTDVVEIGAFAGQGGTGAELVRLLPIVAWCHGMRFILCTVTDTLVETLRRLEVPFHQLGPAVPDWMNAPERQRWGRYYDHHPTTGVIPLDSIGTLMRNCTGRYNFLDLRVATRRPGRGVLADAR